MVVTKAVPLLPGIQWDSYGIHRLLHLCKAVGYLPLQLRGLLLLGGSCHLLPVHEDDCLPKSDLRDTDLLFSGVRVD